MRSSLSRISARCSLLLTAPWLRAPFLLARRPSVALAVAAAAVILGVTSAATPLYISSASNAALHRQVAQTCPWSVGPRVTAAQELDPQFSQGTGVSFAKRDALVRRAAAGVPNVRAPKTTLIAPETPLVGRGGGEALHTLVSRPGFRGHIDVVTRGDGGEVWLHEQSARRLDVRPGDPVTVTSPAVRRPGDALRAVELEVAGTFRELAPRKDSDFWCPMAELIQSPPFSEQPTYPLALVDQEAFLRVGQTAGLRFGETWAFRVDTRGLTTLQASQTSAAIERMARELNTRAEDFTGLNVQADLTHYTERARLVGSSVSGAVGPVAVAGVVVALVLIGAAASYWVERRRPEIDLLVSRGIGPTSLGTKAMLETGLPVVAGTVAGWGLARLLVTGLGPSPLLSGGAAAAGLASATGGLAAAFVLLGCVAALRTRSRGDRPHGAAKGWAAAVPWELGFLVLAGVALVWLVAGGTSVGTVGSSLGTVARVDPLLLAFPLLFLAGAVTLAVRVIGPAVRRLGGGGSRWAVPVYLAARRVGAAPGGTLVLLAATAVPIGVLVYSAALTGSVRATLDAKVHLFSGSDVVVRVAQDAKIPEAVRAETTRVVRLESQSLDGRPVNLLGVEPAELPEEVYWQRSYAGRPLPKLMEAIRHPVGQEPVPVLVAATDVAEGPATLTLVGDAGERVEVAVTVVGTPQYFPGLRGPPIVVIDRQALASFTEEGFPELWARGDGQNVLSALQRADVPVLFVSTAEQIFDVANFLAVAYTFRFLTALALLIGMVGVVTLLLYLEARSRARRVFYVLARRMGLTRRGHLGSLLIELAGLFSAGLLVGGGLAWVAVLTVYRRLDVEPGLPPSPLLPVPLRVLAVVVAAAAAIVVIAALLAQRSVDRARPVEVLRAAE